MKLKIKNVVIPCAGSGERLAAHCRHKCLLDVNGKPLLRHVIDFWKDSCEQFILIVRGEHKPVREAMDNMNVPYKAVIQEKPDGIANAVLRAKDCIQGEMLVVLGDCLIAGTFLFDENIFPGIGIWQKPVDGAVSSNYGALVKDGKVIAVEEKPSRVQNYHCGMGVYFFNEDVFNVIKHMPSPGGKRDITPLLSEYIKCVPALRPVYFKGKYFNVNTEHDMESVRAHYENRH